jgi:hypothetical protein
MFHFQNSEKQQKREYVRIGQIRIEIKNSKSQNKGTNPFVSQFRTKIPKNGFLKNDLVPNFKGQSIKKSVVSHFIKMYPNL